MGQTIYVLIFISKYWVNYDDSSTYNTKLSTVVSIVTIGLIIANVSILSLAYRNGDKQEEKTSFIQVDRLDTLPYNLSEHGVEISLFAEDLDQKELDLFQFSVFQIQSCDENNDTTLCDKKSRTEPIGVAQECSEDRGAQLFDFQKKIYGQSGSKKFVNQPKLCVDTSKLHIKGEPGTRSETSVRITLETRPEIQGYKSDYEYCRNEAHPWIQSCQLYESNQYQECKKIIEEPESASQNPWWQEVKHEWCFDKDDKEVSRCDTSEDMTELILQEREQIEEICWKLVDQKSGMYYDSSTGEYIGKEYNQQEDDVVQCKDFQQSDLEANTYKKYKHIFKGFGQNCYKYQKAENLYISHIDIKAILTYDQLDLKTGQFHRINKILKIDYNGQIEVDLSPRKFTNKNDPIGLFSQDPDPETRLGMEGRSIFFQDRNKKYTLKLQLSDIERSNERQVYQFMVFLSDFGGFNDGIMFLPAILMSIYNSKMFYTLATTFFPVKHRHKPRQSQTSTEQRFSENDSLGQTLDITDVQNVSREAKVSQVEKYPCLKSLFCCLMICKKSKRLRMQQKQNQFIQQQLDIRNLIQARIDLSILINLILNEQQRVLFKNQHLRTIEDFSQSDDNDYSLSMNKQLSKSLALPISMSLNQPIAATQNKQDEFDKLLDYKIETKLDQNLLLGIWSSSSSRLQQHSQQLHIRQKNEQSISPRIVNYEMARDPQHNPRPRRKFISEDEDDKNATSITSMIQQIATTSRNQ